MRSRLTVLTATLVLGMLITPGWAGAQAQQVEPEEFGVRFGDCSPATTTMTFSAGNALIGVRYEIIGPSSDRCAVNLQYLLYPNRSWIGEEMTCELDPSLEIDIALEDMSRCTGALYDLMTAR